MPSTEYIPLVTMNASFTASPPVGKNQIKLPNPHSNIHSYKLWRRVRRWFLFLFFHPGQLTHRLCRRPPTSGVVVVVMHGTPGIFHHPFNPAQAAPRRTRCYLVRSLADDSLPLARPIQQQAAAARQD